MYLLIKKKSVYIYCRDVRPRRVYWAKGPVRGQLDTSVGVQDSGWAKGFSFKVPGSMSEDEFHIGLTEQRSKGLA